MLGDEDEAQDTRVVGASVPELRRVIRTRSGRGRRARFSRPPTKEPKDKPASFLVWRRMILRVAARIGHRLDSDRFAPDERGRTRPTPRRPRPLVRLDEGGSARSAAPCAQIRASAAKPSGARRSATAQPYGACPQVLAPMCSEMPSDHLQAGCPPLVRAQPADSRVEAHAAFGLEPRLKA